MKKQKFTLDSKNKKILKRITKAEYGIKPRAKKKATVILLKSEGKSIKEIQKETKLCKRTIISYIKDYNNPDKNVGKMRFIHKYAYKVSSLEKVTNSDGENLVLNEFHESSPKSYREASERIHKMFGISISESATRVYLNKHEIYTKK